MVTAKTIIFIINIVLTFYNFRFLAELEGFLNCSCSHLTSFGGSLLVEPNPIDFDKVLVEFQQLSETGNIAVIVVIAVILLSYVTVLVIVRKFDEEDAKNVSVEPDFA